MYEIMMQCAGFVENIKKTLETKKTDFIIFSIPNQCPPQVQAYQSLPMNG